MGLIIRRCLTPITTTINPLPRIETGKRKDEIIDRRSLRSGDPHPTHGKRRRTSRTPFRSDGLPNPPASSAESSSNAIHAHESHASQTPSRTQHPTVGLLQDAKREGTEEDRARGHAAVEDHGP